MSLQKSRSRKEGFSAYTERLSLDDMSYGSPLAATALHLHSRLGHSRGAVDDSQSASAGPLRHARDTADAGVFDVHARTRLLHLALSGILHAWGNISARERVDASPKALLRARDERSQIDAHRSVTHRATPPNAKIRLIRPLVITEILSSSDERWKGAKPETLPII